MKKNKLSLLILPCLLAGLFSGYQTFADIRLPSVIASNMVLQQQSNCKLWGWCEPNEKIYITGSWNNQTDSVVGTHDANWSLTIPTPAAGGPYTLTLKGRNTVVLENVMIGEVWICSGQSNMEMSGSWRLPDIQKELPVCATNNIHFFRIPRTTSTHPQDNCVGQWTSCDSNQLKSFSAAAYFFAKKLNGDLKVPVGLIESSWGGTPAEVWTPERLVNENEVLKKYAEKLEVSDGWPNIPGYCYNGMIAPVVSYNIAGALWYQGESNVATYPTYMKLFTEMISSWRKAWNKDFPFYYVQIAPFTYAKEEHAALLREQQARAMSLPGTGMVVISDLVDDTTDIHPKNKHDVGLRLANWALAETYHRSGVVYKNPSFKSMEIKGDKIAIELDNVPQGLLVKGPHVKTLFVAGADRQFYPADAKWENGKWIVHSTQVKAPVAVRYQFSNAAIGNVFGKEGLPMAPFRSDDWE